ncbi:hypothetical protein SNE510_64290 [Streptomyces sp. NE5-10]|nr:hypothetical protein SNE510_64290 [Streptomyces sp. NE5-10]
MVRYLTAIGSLNICGDWYDAVDLTDDRFTVAVIVGHSLKATAVMATLRSALPAASRAPVGPAHALEALAAWAVSPSVRVCCRGAGPSPLAGGGS